MSKVYKDFRQFDDAEILKEAIGLAWDSIEGELLLELAGSMPKRCIEVIEHTISSCFILVYYPIKFSVPKYFRAKNCTYSCFGCWSRTKVM